MSEAIPQKDAPMQRPRNRAQVVNLTWVSLMPNSVDSCVRVKATPWSHKLNKRTDQFRFEGRHVPKLTCQQSNRNRRGKTAAIDNDPFQYPELLC